MPEDEADAELWTEADADGICRSDKACFIADSRVSLLPNLLQSMWGCERQVLPLPTPHPLPTRPRARPIPGTHAPARAAGACAARTWTWR